MIACQSCERRIHSHSRTLTCSLCNGMFHLNCVPYTSLNDSNEFNLDMCHHCITSIFPFNHIEENDLFISAATYRRFNGLNLSNEIFSSFDSSASHDHFDMSDIDPDIQFYNELPCLQNVQNCTYYSESSFQQKCKQKTISDSTLSIVHFNIRSARQNLNSAELFLHNLGFEFKIIALTETWLNDTNCDLYSLNGYNLECKNRTDKTGGGVALLINSEINYTVRNEISIFVDGFESLFIELPKCFTVDNRAVIIGVVYRPPGGAINDFNTKLAEVTSKLKVENKLIYVVGDFNINLLNADSHQLTSDFLDVMYSTSFFPLINRPTRVTDQSATLIDNIFSNDILDTSHFNGVLLSDITDHYPVFTINSGIMKKSGASFIKRRNINAASIKRFKDALSNTNWDIVLRNSDAKTSFESFYETFSKEYSECFPMKQSKVGYTNRKPWLTNGLKSAIDTKNKLFYTMRKNPTEINTLNYKSYKYFLTKLLRKKERDYYDTLLDKYKSNLKKSWNVIKSVINRHKTKNAMEMSIRVNDSVIKDGKLIADNFNRFFVNVGPNLSRLIPNSSANPADCISNNTNTIFINETNETEILNIIRNMKEGSVGPDGISTKILKQTVTLIVKPLVHTLNLSLCQGYFPTALKTARVIPIYKSGDPMEMKNYRPVSVLNVLSKVFEKVMYNRLFDFFDTNNSLYKMQFGFRRLHNANIALSYLLDKIISSLDRGDFVIGTFIDLSKAFDTVNHTILQAKLYKYGVRGCALDWVKSYLEKRSQYVCCNSYESSMHEIRCGVPQGSILGPLLFLIYVNDIMQVSTKVMPLLYADDTNLFCSGKNISEIIDTLNNELTLYMKWMQINKLTVNADKTKVIIFRKPRTKLPTNIDNILLNGKVIEKVSSMKFLGVILDENLSWLTHINNIKSKIAKGIGIICKAKPFLSSSTLLTLYNSFIQPYLLYCIEGWGSTFATYMMPLWTLQKRAVRIIKSLSYRHETLSAFQELHILNVFQLHKYFILIFMFKLRKDMIPTIFKEFFEHANHQYQTRGNLLYRIPYCKTSFSQRSLRYVGAKLHNDFKKFEWNCSIHSFKRSIKLHLLEHDVNPNES